MSAEPLPIPLPPGYVRPEAPETPEATPAWNPVRDAKGRIVSGGGRPKGVRNRRSRVALEAVQDLAPDAVKMLAHLVRLANWPAIKYVLDMTLPAGGRTVELDSAADPNTVIEALAAGDLSPTEFSKIAQGWKTAKDAAELSEIKTQVDELEALVSALKR